MPTSTTGSPSTVYLFGYGSLPCDPELPAHLLQQIPARLDGHRRCFNKISSARHCRIGESFAAFDDPMGCFLRRGYYHSLMLGTEPADPRAGGSIVALLLAYPASVRTELLAATDRREGYDASRLARENGYLRVERSVERLDRSGSVRCLVYLSNLDPACAYHAPDELTLEQRARVLINATPLQPKGPDERRGLYYLERVRASLRRYDIHDAELEALAAAIRALDGPWVELVAAPRDEPLTCSDA